MGCCCRGSPYVGYVAPGSLKTGQYRDLSVLDQAMSLDEVDDKGSPGVLDLEDNRHTAAPIAAPRAFVKMSSGSGIPKSNHP